VSKTLQGALYKIKQNKKQKDRNAETQ